MSDPLVRRRGPWAVLGAFLAVPLLFFGTSPAFAQQGAITGQVVNSQTMAPLAGAQIFVEGTGLGQLTDDEGRYRITGVPAGEQTLRARLIGFREATQTVTVSAGASVTADFQLEQTALKLQEVVVTGVAGATPRAKLPFTVNKIDATEMPVPSASAGGLIQGKIAGATVVRASGQPGDDISIQLRGATSIDASGRSNEPLIVVDGVILGEGARLSDISSLDVESIEVVKGAAASSSYGARAQNGVIQITTKRGGELGQDNFSFTVRGEYGTSQLANEIGLAQYTALRVNPNGSSPDNYYLDADGNPTSFTGAALDCEFTEGTGAEACSSWQVFQDNQFPEPTLYDQVDRFFDPGETSSIYGAFSGNVGNTNFRASVEQFDQEGIIMFETGYNRKNIRLNLDNQPADNLSLNVSGFYSSSYQDETPGGAFFGLTFMAPNQDLLETDENGELIIVPDLRSLEANPLYLTKNQISEDRRQRVMGSGRLVWEPVTGLSLEGTLSYDRTDLRELFLEEKGFKDTDPPESHTDGQMDKESHVDESLNARFQASYATNLGDLTTRTRVQVVAERQDYNFVDASGNQFGVEGVPSLGAISGNTNVNSGQESIRSVGYYLIEALDYRGKYVADAVFRRDGSSLFGENERWNNYFRVSGGWILSEESFWPSGGPVSFFKMRGSYGTAGARPRFSAQYETYDLTAGGGVVPQTLGNADLKPELAKELEVGVNFSLFDKLEVDLTYAESTIEDQLLNVPLPAYFGFESQWRNAGTLESHTYEASITGSPVQTPDLTWTTTFNVDHTGQRITEFDLPPYQWGTKGQYYNREGEVLGTMYGHRWARSCSDLPQPVQSECGQFQVNDEGYLVWVGEGNSYRDGIANQLWGTSTEIAGHGFTWGSPTYSYEDGDPFVVVGNTTPDYNFSLANNITWKGLSLYALLDASTGMEIYNQTIQWAYRERRAGAVDQTGKPEGLKKPTEYYNTLYDVNDISSEFVEDATFLKLRELSLSYTLGQDLTRSLFGSLVERVGLNVIGRNLFTWTDYRGYDPEVGNAGGDAGSAALNREDDYNYPNFREITGAIQIVF